MPSCEAPRHSTNALAPFSRASLNLTIALFTVVLPRFWRSCRSSFQRYAWRARQSFDWIRGTTPTHTPRTPRYVWLSALSLSGWVANESSHCSCCSTPPAPRPPAPPLSPSSAPLLSPLPSPPRLPAPGSTSRVPNLSPLKVLFHRQRCPRSAHCILYLASLDFGGQIR